MPPAPADTTTNFYRDLEPLLSFEAAMDVSKHVDVPSDWWVVIADIVGSTKAIEAGAYKMVNSAGVCCIAAVMNVDREVEIPFIFGGDGATFVVPNSIVEGVREALLGTQKLVLESFKLELRIGMIRVSELRSQDQWVRLTKYWMSEHIAQPAFSGRGWDVAEKLIKSREDGSRYEIRSTTGIIPDVNFEGFECRWQSVPSVNGHKLALLVLAMAASPEENVKIYFEVLDKIGEIYGDVKNFHPLRADLLKLSMRVRDLAGEGKVRTSPTTMRRLSIYLAKVLWVNVIAKLLFHSNLTVRDVKWRGYRQEVVENTDFRKFDGMLRMVIDGNDEQTKAMTYYLTQQVKAGRLVYGAHKSSRALVTCIIKSYRGNHTHFVDGAEGGYALAARQLKDQVAWLRTQRAS